MSLTGKIWPKNFTKYTSGLKVNPTEILIYVVVVVIVVFNSSMHVMISEAHYL